MKLPPTLAKTANYVMALLGISSIPINAEKQETNFSAEDIAKLEEALGKDYAEKIKAGFDQEIKKIAQNDTDMLAVKHELDALVLEANLEQEDLEEAEKQARQNGDNEILAKIKAIGAKQKESNELLAKLIKAGLGDKPEAIIEHAQNVKVMHSKTHLFASSNEWDAFEGRNWNARVTNPSLKATNFTDSTTIEKLNNDLDLYFRKNPEEIKSLHRDNFGLPTFWPKRTKIDDRISDGSIVTAEISQARKLPWLPKNKQKIEAEEGRIFPIQIDIEFVGYFLQKIEASWLNMMNKEGSQPYKESFVRFLVSEIDKKARQEDKVATIKGVYVQTPEDATVPAKFINRQDGLLYLLGVARDYTKKFRPFDIGLPTTTNIVDYVDTLIKRLPDNVRESQGLVLYLSDEWLRAYKRRYELIYGGNTDYSGYPEYPKDYENIKFQRLPEMSGSDLMFITFDDNIEILENVPQEKSMYHFEYLKRIIYIWADYKLGIRFIHIGNKVKDGDPLEFEVQTIWSNTAPVLPTDFFIPVYDDETGEVVLRYNNIEVTKDWGTNITVIKGQTPGTIVKIKGNTGLAAVKNVVNSADIILTGGVNFDLSTGGTLTLFVQEDGKLKELGRTNAPATTPSTTVTFDSAVIDANEGDEFQFNGAATTAITSVINGVPGKQITIYGTAAAGVNVTLSTTGNISVTAAATLATASDSIDLILVDGTWTETSRTIA